MTPDEMIAVIQAHKDGKEIQHRTKVNDDNESAWSDVPANLPSWSFDHRDYRVKPEPPKPREWWLGRCSESARAWKLWDSIPPLGCDSCERVRVREVLEAPSVEQAGNKILFPIFRNP